MSKLDFSVVFEGAHSFTNVIDKRRLVFLECTFQFLIDDVLAVAYTVDTSDNVTITPEVSSVTFEDFVQTRSEVNVWLDFVKKERGGGIDPNAAIGVTAEIIVVLNEIKFEMKRGAVRLTEGSADITTKVISFDSTPTLVLSLSEFLLWNLLLDTLAASIESL